MILRRRILVIDDEPKTRHLLRELLSHDYDIITAANGSDALEQLKSQFVDLILLDLMMPVMDGWQVLKRLKGNKQTRTIPVIMLTADGDTKTVLTSQELKATDYFIKPFLAYELLAFIKRYV